MTIDWIDAFPVPLAVLELLNCRYVAQRNAPVIDVHVSRISSNALILVDAIQISVGIRSSNVRQTINMTQTTSLPHVKNKYKQLLRMDHWNIFLLNILNQEIQVRQEIDMNFY